MAENKIFPSQSAGIFFDALVFLWRWRRKIIVAENKIFPSQSAGFFLLARQEIFGGAAKS
ncbi:MAG: hypothetical protein IKN16_10795 [Selenomonadaceae bacterium]|nr:hypothetical protein [Selenomonadaceae bacterium]